VSGADLLDRLPADAGDEEALYEAFVAWTEDRGISLYPAQDEAVFELVAESNVIMATPTGSGKSMVAVAAHFMAVARGQRSFYTAPIKALVSEKFFDLCEVFGAENVGMMTGDAAVNADAPIVCATAEIVANLALRGGADADIGQVVMDEFHYYAEPERGWAWQVPLIELPRAQFVLMSATLGDVSDLRTDLTRRTGRETAWITGAERPVPLEHTYVLTPVHETIEQLVTSDKAPIYVVHFTQAAALERAQSLTSVNLCSRAEKAAISEAIGGFRFATGFGRTLSRLLKHGVGVHHAGMLPKYRRLVERLAQDGLLKVICGTDTLGVGINVPIRTVLLTGLTKYDGQRTRVLRAREFHQIAGRAGRAGFDTEGFVVVQAPEHDIENHRALAKAGDDPKKRRKVQRKKAPEGFVSWSDKTFERLVAAPPEPLVSRFHVTNAMILDVLARPGNCFTAMRHLLEDNHEPRPRQRRHILRAIALYRSLLASGVVEQLDAPDELGRYARPAVDLQEDFALNQPLSPFALAALDLLDRDSVDYALDVISVVEATLEDPRPVLRAQQHEARGEAVAEMKADGIEYEERMELLEEITWPKPLVDLLEPMYQTYRETHPWLDEFGLKPKSVVREMVEYAMTFSDMTSRYGLARSEGALLRYLTDAYRALRQTVPVEASTEELDDVIEWLGSLIRLVDSSLLDEWEQLTDPDFDPAEMREQAFALDDERSITDNPRALKVMLRNAMFRRLSLAADRRWAQLADFDEGLSADDWAAEMDPFFDEYGEVDMGPDARGPHMFRMELVDGEWELRQTIPDPDGDNGWALLAVLDAEASDEVAEVVLGDIEVVAG